MEFHEATPRVGDIIRVETDSHILETSIICRTVSEGCEQLDLAGGAVIRLVGDLSGSCKFWLNGDVGKSDAKVAKVKTLYWNSNVY